MIYFVPWPKINHTETISGSNCPRVNSVWQILRSNLIYCLSVCSHAPQRQILHNFGCTAAQWQITWQLQNNDNNDIFSLKHFSLERHWTLDWKNRPHRKPELDDSINKNSINQRYGKGSDNKCRGIRICRSSNRKKRECKQRDVFSKAI